MASPERREEPAADAGTTAREPLAPDAASPDTVARLYRQVRQPGSSDQRRRALSQLIGIISAERGNRAPATDLRAELEAPRRKLQPGSAGTSAPPIIEARANIEGVRIDTPPARPETNTPQAGPAPIPVAVAPLSAAVSASEPAPMPPRPADRPANLDGKLHQAANEAEKAGRYEDAERLWATALEKSGPYAEALFGRGRALDLMGRVDDAIASLREAHLIRPEDYRPGWRLMGLLERHERLDEALAVATDLGRLNPEEVRFVRTEARVLWRLKRLDEADEACDRGLAIDPGDLWLSLTKVRILRHEGRVSEAIIAGLRLLQLHPHAVEIYSELFIATRSSREDGTYHGLLRDLQQLHASGRIPAIVYARVLVEAGQITAAQAVLAEVPQEEAGTADAASVRLACMASRNWLLDVYETGADAAAFPPHTVQYKAIRDAAAAVPFCRDKGVVLTNGRATPTELLSWIVKHMPPGSPRLGGVRKRSVLFIGEHLGMGGFARWVINTLAGLRARYGGDIEIAGFWPRMKDEPGYDFLAGEALAAGVRVLDAEEVAAVELPAEVRGRLLLEGMPEGLRQRCSLDKIEILAKAIWLIGPDVVDLHAERQLDINGAIAGLACGTGRISISHANPAPPWYLKVQVRTDDLVDGFEHERALYRRLLAFPQIGMTNNAHSGIADFARWLDLPVTRFRFLRNGTDHTGLDDWSPERVLAIRERLGIPEGAFVVGSAFRYMPQKEPLLWIEVAARFLQRHPDAHFLLLGDGRLLPKMLEAAWRLDLLPALHLPGPQLEMGCWYRVMDVFLLTSVSEGMPNVSTEAQYCGVPMVLSDVGGSAESVVPDRTGWIVADHTDIDGYLGRLEFLYANRDVGRAVRSLGPEFVNRTYSIDAMIGDLLAAYGWEGSA